MSTQVANEPATLTEAILGKELITSPLFSKVRAWPAELRAALFSVLLASAVLLPYLGAVGLWDPWEVHYGEVAREMIERNDYIHPFWENAWFFSKPAFTMWMQALGLQAAELGPILALLLAVLLGGLGAFLYAGRGAAPGVAAGPGLSKGAQNQVLAGLALMVLGVGTSALSYWAARSGGKFIVTVGLIGSGFTLLVRGLRSGPGGEALKPLTISPHATREFWGVLGMTFGAFFLVLYVWSQATTLPWRFSTAAAGPDTLPKFTEWGFRLPFAGFSILAIGLMTYALTIAVSARAALASALVLITMPLYFLLSRQAVTDTPIVSATIAGIACAMVGLFDKTTKYRSQWWYASYVLFAIATLAKGLLGFGVPMVVFIVYVALREMTWKSIGPHFKWLATHLVTPMISGLGGAAVVGGLAYTLGKKWNTTFMAVPVIDNVSLISAPTWLAIMWGSLAFWAITTILLGQSEKATLERPPPVFAMAYDMRLGTGILLFLAVCLPWYYEMFTFWRVDDESKIFWFRFIIHDHFARLGSGVHTANQSTATRPTPSAALAPRILSRPAATIAPGMIATQGNIAYPPWRMK